MKRFGNWILGAAVLTVWIAGSGCVALVVGGAAAGAGTAVYLRGELQATVDGTLDRSWNAAQTALNTLQMPITEQQRDGLSGKLTARGLGDKKVTVRLKKVTGTATEIGIRVGTWGDETKSRQILDEIKKHL